MRVVSLLEYRRFVEGLDPPEGAPTEWLSPRLAVEAAEYQLPLEEIVDYIWT
jgi:hypothetical protein